MKNDLEASVLCMTALGTILLQQDALEDVKVTIDSQRFSVHFVDL